MRKHILHLTILALLCSFAVGQSAPRVDVFGGYSYLRSAPGSGISGANGNGWDASLNWNWKSMIGLKADVSGSYCCNGQREHNFLFGPQLTFRGDRANFFVHGLGGVSHGTASGFSDNAVAWAFGGGVDWKVRHFHGLALRLAQVDYLGTKYGGATQHNFRYSTGLVFSFGGK